MGAIVVGKKYRTATCKICGFEYETDESTQNGVSEEDLEDFSNLTESLNMEIEEGDDICLNCWFDFWEDNNDIDAIDC